MDTPITRAELQSAKKNQMIEIMVVKIRRSVLEEAQEGNTKVQFRVEAHVEEVLERVRKIFPDCTVTCVEEGVILVDWS
jgi:hypothetical protein